MKKIKKLILANKILSIGLILVICFAIVGAVNAFSGNAGQVVEHADVVYYTGQSVNDGNFGTVASVGGICNGSEPTTQLCNVNVYDIQSQTDITADATVSAEQLTSTDDITIADQISQNGVIGDWLSGTCTDATTTPFAVLNPESATVVVDQWYLRVQNGTSTINFTMGTSTSQFLSADPTDLLIDDVSIATSTYGTATTTLYFQNQTADGSTVATSGFTDNGTNAEPAILWKSGEYISAFIEETDAGSGGWTGGNNMAECYYRIHYTKME